MGVPEDRAAARLNKILDRIREVGPGGIAILDCLYENRRTDGLSKSQLAELIGCVPDTLDSFLRKLTDNSDSAGCPLVNRSGQKRATKYAIGRSAEAAYVFRRRHPNREGLVKSMASAYLDYWDNKLDDPTLDSFNHVELSQMVHPGFVLDENLRIVGCSDSFLRLFRIRREDLPIDALEQFLQLKEFDVSSEQMTGQSLTDLLLGSLREGNPIDNVLFNYTPTELETLYLEAFITLQKSRIGIQGTLVNATPKLRIFGQKTAAAAELSQFAMQHEVGTKLSALHMDLVVARQTIAKEVGAESDSLRVVKEIITKIGDVHDWLYEWNLGEDGSSSESNVVGGISTAIQRANRSYPAAKVRLESSEVKPGELVTTPMSSHFFRTVVENLVRNSIEAALDRNVEKPDICVHLRIDADNASANISVINHSAVEIPSKVVELVNSCDETNLKKLGQGLARCVEWVRDTILHENSGKISATTDRIIVQLPVEIGSIGGADSIGDKLNVSSTNR